MKHVILSNTPSKPLTKWENPFTGFAVHVNADDSFTVYSIGRACLAGVNANKISTVEGIQELERNAIQIGNPHGILITSDRPLGESKTFPALLNAIFVPSIQLFYLSTK